MKTFNLEIDFSEETEQGSLVVMKNCNDFKKMCLDTISEVKAIRNQQQNKYYKETIYLGNFGIFAYTLSLYFPSKLIETKSSRDYKNTKDTLEAEINKLVLSKESGKRDRINPFDRTTIATNYIIFKDLNLICGHDAPYWSDNNSFEKDSILLQSLDKKFEGHLPKSQVSYVSSLIRSDSDEMKRFYYKMHKITEGNKSRLMSFDEINGFRKYLKGGLAFYNTEQCNRIIRDCYCYDYNSAYIYQMANRQFPTSAPYKIAGSQEFEALIKENKRFWMATIRLSNIKLQIRGINPYKIKDTKETILYVTNLDWSIVKEAYYFDYEFIEGFYFISHDKLPESFVNIQKGLFETKQELKKHKHEPDFDSSFYEWVKRCLVINYGILSKKHFYSDNLCNIFWGIFVTAWQRYTIWQTIHNLGFHFLYCHTDSIYSLSPCWDLVEGLELGQVEREDLQLFIMNTGVSQYAKIVDDRVELTIGGVANESSKKFADYYKEFVFDMFLDKSVVIPKNFKPTVRYTYNNLGECYIKMSDYHIYTNINKIL